jgi:predicted transport protein
MSTSNLMLPRDPTGSAASNLVQNEPHAIGATGVRAFPLNYGLFFRDSLVLKDANGNTLVEGTQYYPTQMDLKASLATGEEIDAVVIITDTTVTANVTATYQAYGGPNSLNAVQTQAAIVGLDIDSSAVSWSEVQNIPKTFPPGPHVHQAGDVFGLEYITAALSRLAAGITEGQGGAQAALLQYAEDVVAELNDFIAEANAELTAHTSNFCNPHETTAEEIGAYTEPQTDAAIALEATNRTAADAAIEAALATHEADHENPHELTPAQVGGYTTAQSDSAMQAMQTALLATIAANEATQNAHITNYENPHQTTAAQIGTWTTPQIATAIANASTTLQNQVSAFQTTLQAHEANTSNPHQDNVTNVGTWTTTSINAGIVSPFSAHSSNVANPHQDIYTNIVTSNVDSSGVYSATTMSNSISSAASGMLGSINSLNSTIASHTGNFSNPHGDNYANTGGAYTVGQLQYAVSLLQGPGGSAANAINYLASINNA